MLSIAVRTNHRYQAESQETENPNGGHNRSNLNSSSVYPLYRREVQCVDIKGDQ